MKLKIMGLAAALVSIWPAYTYAQGAESQCRPLQQQDGARGDRAGSLAAQAWAQANNAARQRPEQAGFDAARYVYTYAPGALYELYANPNFISAILLEEGETLEDVAAGDTSRWSVTQSVSAGSLGARTILLVKPQSPNLRTNIVLVTDRRTYLVEAVSHTRDAYSAEIAWCYPEAAPTHTSPSPIRALNFEYRVRTIRGRRPLWTPTHIFDDGRRTWIEFGDAVDASDLPPLFIITGEGAELTNYRLDGRRYMVDRVFDIAELRLGVRAQSIVRIERTSVAQSRAPRRRRP